MSNGKDKVAGTAAPVVTPTKTEIDYSTYTKEQLLESIGKAYAAKDMRLMASLSKLYTKKEAAEESAKRDALLAELVAKTDEVKKAFDQLAQKLIDSRRFDGAEGFWYAKDFGDNLSAMRLTKGAKKTASAGGTKSYVTNPAKTADLLAEVGSHVYIKEATTATIEKSEVNLPAGLTFQQAYDKSTDGNWRYRVRMALLKEAGKV